MKRRIAIALLALGTALGYGSALAHAFGHAHGERCGAHGHHGDRPPQD